MLPTFLVIGAMKAGTTSLWHHLRAHPQIFTPAEKELAYFIAEKNWGRGQNWYLDQFAGAGDATAIGEASPEYTLAHAYPGVPGRIADLIPDAKLIYLLRDPMKRLRSHYLERLRAGSESRSPERALREHPGYVRASQYAWQLEHYLSHFPREQILLITTEGLRGSYVETMRSVYSFLDVDPGWTPPEVSSRTNTTGEVYLRKESIEKIRDNRLYRAAARLTPAPLRRLHFRVTTKTLTTSTLELPAELEERIRAQIRPDIMKLRAYMGPGFDGWGIA